MNIRRILICPNSFKGTLLSPQVSRLLAAAIKEHRPDIQPIEHPLADGGDGTLDVLLSHFKGKKRSTVVNGPLGKPVAATWGLIHSPKTRKRIAIIEMARASGLALVGTKNNIMKATSFGTGQLIRAALNQGCRDIWIGVGGTATGDGGAGALRALGLRYYDSEGKILSGSPTSMKNVARLDWTRFDQRIFWTKIGVLCDVRNPLSGSRGSARVFGPQKGATPSQVEELDAVLKRWSKFAPKKTQNQAGAGAAGALAFGLSGFAGARLLQGADFILKSTGWKSALKKCDAIITGEGRIDETSFHGKVLGEIAQNRGSKPLYGLCGTTPFSQRQYRRKGFTMIVQMGRPGLRRPVEQLTKAATKLFHIL